MRNTISGLKRHRSSGTSLRKTAAFALSMILMLLSLFCCNTTPYTNTSGATSREISNSSSFAPTQDHNNSDRTAVCPNATDLLQYSLKDDDSEQNHFRKNQLGPKQFHPASLLIQYTLAISGRTTNVNRFHFQKILKTSIPARAGPFTV